MSCEVIFIIQKKSGDENIEKTHSPQLMAHSWQFQTASVNQSVKIQYLSNHFTAPDLSPQQRGI